MQHRITEHCDGHACKLEYSMGSTGNPVAQPYTNIKTAEKKYSSQSSRVFSYTKPVLPQRE